MCVGFLGLRALTMCIVSIFSVRQAQPCCPMPLGEGDASGGAEPKHDASARKAAWKPSGALSNPGPLIPDLTPADYLAGQQSAFGRAAAQVPRIGEHGHGAFPCRALEKVKADEKDNDDGQFHQYCHSKSPFLSVHVCMFICRCRFVCVVDCACMINKFAPAPLPGEPL